MYKVSHWFGGLEPKTQCMFMEMRVHFNADLKKG